MITRVRTYSTAMAKGGRQGHTIRISPSRRAPAFEGGLELNIVSPFNAKVSLTRVGASEYWKNFVLSCATGPLVAHWLINLEDYRSGRMSFPGLMESPLIDLSMQLENNGWRMFIYTCDRTSKLAEVSGTRESWRALSDWQYAD